MHAYMIMAHGHFPVLKKLLIMLDDARNDIYVHIDKKCREFSRDDVQGVCRRSKVEFVESLDVKWGGYSFVQCELNLLKKACEKPYDRLHLLSGVCMPIKTQDEIHAFFDKYQDREFVYFENANPTDKVRERVKFYHFFAGRRNLFNRTMTYMETTVQGLLGVDRIRRLDVQKGSNWFSVTQPFARYILENEPFIRRQFRHTLAGDEFFVQTLLINSPFRDKLYCDRFDNSNEQNMRYVDWNRGNPYTFQEQDFDEIMDSGMLFVRKLTDQNGLPDRIFRAVMGKDVDA